MYAALDMLLSRVYRERGSYDFESSFHFGMKHVDIEIAKRRVSTSLRPVVMEFSE